MHVDKPTYPEVSLRDLDGLVKSLHKKYDIHVSTKPIGLNAYFDPKDTEKAREGKMRNFRYCLYFLYR